MAALLDARVQKFRRLLETKRDELRDEGDLDVSNDDRGDVVEKVDEDQAPLTEMNQVIASSRNRTRARQLAEIQAALERLDEDPEEFGSCEDCDDEIPARRLELVPWARLCIKCQETREANDGRSTRRHLTDYK